MMTRFSCCAMALALATAVAPAADYFVSPHGDDAAPGTRERPFRTIQKAADRMAPGDTCWLREGVYRQTVHVTRGGAEGKPVRFAAHPGEVVTLSGTEPLKCPWTVHKGSIYKAAVDRQFDQLFVDGEMMVEARWPNMRLEELWDRSKWAKAARGSRYGKMRDRALVATGVDWTGALATLNVTHQFYTWTRPVTGHEAGRDFFEYPKDFGKANEMRYATRTRVWEDDRYYLSGKLEALDMPTEWFLDRKTRTLYLWAEDGKSPASRRVEAKARDYGFRAEGVDYVELEGLHLFGATFEFMGCSHCVVDGCHLLFPTYARELTDLAPKRVNTLRTAMYGDFNTVRNSSIAFTPVQGLLMRGRQNRVENCIVHDVCWNGSLRYTAISMAPDARSKAEPGGVVRRCTAFNAGNAIINYRGQPYVVELNHVHHGGLACKDVALVYTGQPSCAGSVVRRNWVHGCRTEEGSGLGIRGDDQTRRLTVHHNVVWDCGRDGIIVKGDFNKVHNNTTLFIGTKGRLGNYIAMPVRAEPRKPWRRQHPLLKVQNANSQIFNNAARTVVGNQGRRTPFPPGDNLANTYRGADPGLVDVGKWDFRPRPDSPLVDAGRVIPGFTDGFQGKAPDIGAYEHGGDHWKPGHRNGLAIAHRIVPSEGAGQLSLFVALAMPVRQPVEVHVEAKAGRVVNVSPKLRFTPQDWMRPQQVTFAVPAGPVAVRFTAGAWGAVELSDARAVKANTGVRRWFEQPDLGRVEPLDRRFRTDHFPGRPAPKRRLRPAARAFHAQAPVRIDGQLEAAEWPGWTPARGLLLLPLRGREDRSDAAGEAYALFDESHLYVAFRVRRAEAGAMRREGGEWGTSDGVEVDLQPIAGNKLGPVFVLHGFPSGALESVVDGGASAAQAAALGKAAAFAAQVGEGGWTAEFRIPLAAMGADAKGLERLRFNVGARCGVGEAGEWFAWVRTRGANYALGSAGDLVLRPACRATATSLLRNGGFEAKSLAPWRKTNNMGKERKGQFVRRVREGADGGWCARIECEDAALMARGVLKCLQSLDAKLGPGTYVLSYDLRVEGLKPRDRSGMVCGYIRTASRGGGGRNAGQMEHAFVGSDLPWTRRDCVIEVPEGARPSFVSLQLHKATGVAWVDNASLLPCE